MKKERRSIVSLMSERDQREFRRLAALHARLTYRRNKRLNKKRPAAA